MASPDANVDLASIPVNLSSTIYYKDKVSGEYVEWVALANAENRIWIDGNDIPALLEEAFIAIEDERFYEHQGVDWKRTIAAGINIITGDSTFGGSTITQQLIKNLTQDNEVTIKRKLLEICRALKLEQEHTKEEILEWYLNIIYFGYGQYGVGTAADYYFGKDVDQLTLAEMCSLAGIINNPSKYNPYVFPENNKKRQELILDKMLELGYIDQATCDMAKTEQLVFSSTHSQGNETVIYPYYVDAVIDDVIEYFEQEYSVSQSQATVMLYYGGYHIYTCVDMDIQSKMDSVYQDISNIPQTRDGQTLQSSMVIIDPYTGDIVGLEGGVGEKSVSRGLNWATSPLARRPPGSSIKPISVYGPGIEMELITPDTVFLDSADIQLSGTDWFPKNDNGQHYGAVTVRYGVLRSLNTIAAQVMDKVTPSASYDFLVNKLHMTLEAADCDYAPLAVGQLTIGTTTREMASAYTIFPSGGTYIQGRTFSEIYDSDGNLVYENKPVTNQAISAITAYWMTDMLEDAVDSGTGTAAKLSGMPCAGKTGTTTDSKDRWFVGYTPYYVGAVWTGYEKPAEINVSGNPAAALWKQVMSLVHEDLEYKDFPVPEDTTLTPIQYYSFPEEPEEEDEFEEPGYYWNPGWAYPQYPGMNNFIPNQPQDNFWYDQSPWTAPDDILPEIPTTKGLGNAFEYNFQYQYPGESESETFQDYHYEFSP